MTGSCLLHLRDRLPSVGTVFTTHATMLGRALSSMGHSPEDGLAGKTPAELAEEQGVEAKHSLEAPEAPRGVSLAPSDQSGKVERRPFDLERVCNTEFEIDHYQPVLYVLESFEQLRDAMNEYAERVLDEAKAPV